MITTSPSPSARSTKPARSLPGAARQASQSLAPDYRLLGLRPREARVEVIREAVHQAASQVQIDQAAQKLESDVAVVSQPADAEQLSQIATAGYRLLDPRRRRTLFERVQLLMWTEEELDATLKSLWATEPVAPPRIKIAIKPAAKAVRSQSDASPDDENQIALELFRNIRRRDRRALALWIGVASLTVSLASVLALFAFFAQ